MKNPLLCSLGVALLSAGVAASAGAASPDISRGAVLASTCFTCHGTDGKSPGEIPSIYGVPASSLEKTLKDFKSGMREGTVMDRHAKGYTDEEIREIAEYLSRIE